MNSGIFQVDFEGLKSALVSTILMAVLGVAGYIIGLGDIFQIDWRALANVGVMALLTGVVSLIKNFLTSDSGKFANITKIE